VIRAPASAVVLIGVAGVIGAVIVVIVSRRVLARWRAFVAQRAACLLLDLLENCPDLFAQEVEPGKYCPTNPSTNYGPSFHELNGII